MRVPIALSVSIFLTASVNRIVPGASSLLVNTVLVLFLILFLGVLLISCSLAADGVVPVPEAGSRQDDAS